jgi:ATP-dependent RNA helicase DHX8/PRP22
MHLFIQQQRCKQLPAGTDKLLVRPIFAALPKEEQLKAFAPTPAGSRKVILATNIAESSITLPGVKFVVDPGQAKQRCYRAQTGMESLVVRPISQQQAGQRAGRAGREGPGKCFRLFREDDFLALRAAAVPEIMRCNLATVALQLKVGRY